MSTKELILTDMPDKITIEKKNGDFKTTIIKNKAEGSSKEYSFPLFGLYGAITLGKGAYLICITEADSVGIFKEEIVYEIKKVKLVKYKTINEEKKKKGILQKIFEEKNDSSEIQLVMKFFSLPGNYFSESDISESSFSKGKTSFTFNHALLNNLKKVTDDHEIISCKSFFGSFCSKNENGVNIFLISRRSRHRVGTRFFSKGADLNGHSSNFVETVQIVEYEGKQNHFVQIRGSIPLKWKNKLTIKKDPLYFIEESETVFKNSEKKMKENYKRIFYLNLIKKEGYEKRIYCAFDKLLNENKCEFLHFDVAKEIVEKKESCFLDLEEKMKNVLEGMEYFSETNHQKGVIRTNCIDSTDRTNVCQFVLGRYVMRNQIKNLNLEFSPEMERILKEAWYLNGDNLSIQYTGTVTSLGPIVFKGKKTFFTKIKDFYVNLKRYFINRFSDGSTFNSLLLMTGKKNYFEIKPKEVLLRNFGLFLLVFVAVTIYKHLFDKFRDASEQVIAFGISFLFLFYLVYTVDAYFDVPEYD